MTSQNIIIANSLALDRQGNFLIHSPSRWTTGVKHKSNWFCYYPWELAYLAALLKRETDYRVKFIDGCLEGLNAEKYFQRLINQEPDWLVLESSTRSYKEDLKVAKRVKEHTGCKLIFCGQHPASFPQAVLKEGIDYVCLGEYEYTVLEIVQGKSPDKILGLYPNPRRPLLDVNALPWPEDEDVQRINYALPGEPSSQYLEIQMYASRGCPGSCSFCVARHVYYAQANWRRREIKDIIAEIKYLKNKYPQMAGIFFDEEAHNIHKTFVLELTRAIRENGLAGLHYEAMCALQFLDREILEAMHASGYYQIRVGLETASSKIGRDINKTLDLKRVESILQQAKTIGISMYGTFMFGAPGSTKEEDLKTIKFMEYLIKEGLLDNLQLSICTPQPGTPFYHWARQQGYLVRNDHTEFDGGNFACVSYPGYSYLEIEQIKDLAFLIRDHTFLIKRLANPAKRNYWLKRFFTKYKWRDLLAKIWRRLIIEYRYHRQKWLNFPS